jgi:phosphatidylinositol glycan class V
VLGVTYLYDFLVQRRPIALLSGIVLGVGSLGSLYPPYAAFCPGRPWCEDLIPSLYGYAQGHYWNVGIFKYWTLGNIPNFLFGAPVIALQILAIRRYWNEHRALCLSNLMFLVMILCVAHVQIVIRVSGFIPLSYWYLSEEIGHGRGKGWVLYSIGWSVLGTVLYSCFLPPA